MRKAMVLDFKFFVNVYFYCKESLKIIEITHTHTQKQFKVVGTVQVFQVHYTYTVYCILQKIQSI